MPPETPPVRFGPKLRTLRRNAGLSQAYVAQQLDISPSYLNLIENNHRPLPAPLLVKVAQLFQVDLRAFAPDEDARLLGDLYEAFSDGLFEEDRLNNTEVRELVGASPACARAVLRLYRAYQEARASAEMLASRLADGEGVEVRALIPSEEVSELIQRHMNHFPALEQGAEELWRGARLDEDDLYPGLVGYLERDLGVRVRVARRGEAGSVLRRYDPAKKTLTLSELLPTRSRNFQLAAQIGLMTQRSSIDEILRDERLSTDESRNLARAALANYFAGAVLMPYGAFLKAARGERYDIDVLGRRFRVGFEQVCHRLTTLRRPGQEGVPFHMIRIDVAGNISKRFSASGIHFARFSGACPRWNIFAAFLTPGMIRLQTSRMPDGTTYFCLARTIQRDSGGYHAQHPILAIGLGCQVQFARELVYSDGVDLKDTSTAVPVGVTCRMCERDDCEQRAFPSLRHPLRVDENVRRLSLYSSGPR
jgi:predicted transcriptional regulator/DNA-binding XRE family transcriptional regulator